MCRSGDEVGNADRRLVDTRRHEAGDVGDVGQMVGADSVGCRLDTLKLHLTWVGGEPRDDDVRLERFRLLVEPFVVDVARLFVHLVLFDFVGLPSEVGRVAVAEVATVVQVERKDLIARFKNGRVDTHVRLRPGVRLDVNMVRPPQLFGTGNGEFLDGVGVLTAGVVTLSRVAFGVLVREGRPLGLHDGL